MLIHVYLMNLNRLIFRGHFLPIIQSQHWTITRCGVPDGISGVEHVGKRLNAR